MLVYCQLLYVLLVLLGVFIDFLPLTYSQDAKVASSCFLLFLVPGELKNKYSRNWKRKLFYEVLYRKTSEARRGAAGGATGGPHPAQARPHLWPRLAQVWPSWTTSGSALSPIYTPRRENPRYNVKS